MNRERKAKGGVLQIKGTVDKVALHQKVRSLL